MFNITIIQTLIILVLSNSLYAINAEEEYKKGNYDKALEVYSKKLKKDKDNNKLKYNIGNIYYKKNDIEKSKNFYSDIETEDQDILFKDYYNLGNVLYKQNKLKEAISYYKKALDINSSDMDAKFNLEYLNNLLREDKDKDKTPDKKQEEHENKQDKEKEKDKKKEQDKNKMDNKDKKNEEKQNKQNKDENKQKENKNKQDNQKQDNKEKQDKNKDKQEQKKKQDKKDNQKKDEKQGQNKPEEQKKDEKQPETPSPQDSGKDKEDKEEFSTAEIEMLLNQIDEDKNVLKNMKKREVKAGKGRIQKDW